MPDNTINFSRWLERLGIKKGGSGPVLLDTIQPVVIARDLSHLVSMPLRASGLVGGAPASSVATDVPILSGVCPAPMLVTCQLGSSVATPVAFRIGAPFTILGPTVLTPQPFVDLAPLRDSFESVWTMGTVAIAALPLPGLPTVRVPAATNTIGLDVGIWVPGGFTLSMIHTNSGGQTASFYASFYELPSDIAP
jgi:hypothetical protein